MSSGTIGIDEDTCIMAGTGEAALRAAGAVCAAVDAVSCRELRAAFCVVRPPGHHAERSKALGFCFFNNVAVGVEHARRLHGIRRVAIVDFDVHHGNGTQDMFATDPVTLYAYTHQAQLFFQARESRESAAFAVILSMPPCPQVPGP